MSTSLFQDESIDAGYEARGAKELLVGMVITGGAGDGGGRETPALALGSEEADGPGVAAVSVSFLSFSPSPPLPLSSLPALGGECSSILMM